MEEEFVGSQDPRRIIMLEEEEEEGEEEKKNCFVIGPMSSFCSF